MPIAGGQRVYELPARVKAARRGAYSDNREVLSAASWPRAAGERRLDFGRTDLV